MGSESWHNLIGVLLVSWSRESAKLPFTARRAGPRENQPFLRAPRLRGELLPFRGYRASRPIRLVQLTITQLAAPIAGGPLQQDARAVARHADLIACADGSSRPSNSGRGTDGGAPRSSDIATDITWPSGER